MWSQVLFIGLVGGAANLAPVLTGRLPWLNVPVDGYVTIRKRRLFGDNKTWRGVLSGVLFGVLSAIFFNLFFEWFSTLSVVASLGFVVSLGALLGDMFFSFVKRQFDLKPGRPFVPFDQIDWIIGSWLAFSLFSPVSWVILLVLFAIFAPIHAFVNVVGYFSGLKKSFW